MSSQRYFHQLSGASHNHHVKWTRLLNITINIKSLSKMEEKSSQRFHDIRAATVFTGLAVIIIILCIIAFVLFFMCRQAPIHKLFSKYLHDSEKNTYMYIYNAKRIFKSAKSQKSTSVQIVRCFQNLWCHAALVWTLPCYW